MVQASSGRGHGRGHGRGEHGRGHGTIRGQGSVRAMVQGYVNVEMTTQKCVHVYFVNALINVKLRNTCFKFVCLVYCC